MDKTRLSVEQVFGEMYHSCPAGPDEQEAGCYKKKKTHPLTANDFIFSPTCEEHAVTSVFFFSFSLNSQKEFHLSSLITSAHYT